MRAKQINSDIYKLSSTMYGGERFKLVIEAIRQQEKNNQHDPQSLPKIDTTFTSTREREDYRRIVLDFYLMNFLICPMLEKKFICGISGFLIMDTNQEDEDKVESWGKQFLRVITSYFILCNVVEEINLRYKIDLLTHEARKQVEEESSFLKDFSEQVRTNLPDECIKIDNFTDEEMTAGRQMVESLMKSFHMVADVDD